MLIGYIRVAAPGDEESEPKQRAALNAAGVRLEDVVIDFATGSLDRRPALDRCASGLQSGDILVASRLDRLGRSLPDLIAFVLALKARGAALRCLDGTLDTSIAEGRIAIDLLEALAFYTRALDREVAAARVTTKRRRGRMLAGPSEAAIDKILEAVDHGASKPGVCRAFGIHPETLDRLLKLRGRDV